ncbi:MAG TPA: S16 family serine protease [Phycisphaerae bacterium]|nr:S16 family serine protease [Phycisphaerae bacterium]
MRNIRVHFYVTLWLTLAVAALCVTCMAQSAEGAAKQVPFNGKIPVLGQLTGSTDQVWAVAFVPNTNKVLSSGNDGVIRLWDLNTLQQIRTFSSDAGPIHALCVSPDGRTFVTASLHHVISVWDIATGNRISTFTCNSPAFAAAISPDGNWVVIGTQSGGSMLNLKTGQEVTAYAHKDGGDRAVAWSPNGQYVAAAGDKSRILIWSMQQHEFNTTLVENTGMIGCLAYTPDGRYLFCGGRKANVTQWDLSTDQKVQYVTLDGYVCSLAVTPDDRYLFAVGDDRLLHIWPLAGAARARVFGFSTEHTSAITSVAVSSDGNYALLGSQDRNISVLELNATTDTLPTDVVVNNNPLPLTPDQTPTPPPADNTPAPSGNAPTANQTPFDGRIPVLGQLGGNNSQVWAVAFVPRTHEALSFGDDEIIRLWDLNTLQQIRTFTGDTNPKDGWGYGLSVSPDGKTFVSVNRAGEVRVWDIATGNQISTFTCGANAFSAAISPDDNWVVIGTQNGGRMWNLHTGEEVPAYVRNDGAVFAVAWSPDGAYVANAGQQSQISIWSMQQQKFIATLSEKTLAINGLAYTPDGRYLFCCGRQANVTQWDLATHQKVQSITLSRRIWDLAITPDGHYLFAVGDNQLLYVWPLAGDGRVFGFSTGHTSAITSVAVSSDGNYALLGSRDGTISLLGLTAADNNAPSTDVVVSNIPSPSTPGQTQTPSPGNNTPSPPGNAPTPISISNAPPPANLPVDPNAIFRPQYQNTQKNFQQVQAEIHGLVVLILDNGDMVGQTLDIIATVMNNQGNANSGQVAFDDNQVGPEMRESLQDASRAVHLRYPIWQNGVVHISFGDEYSSKDGGSAGGAFAILILSTLENFNIDDTFAMTGEITVDWKLRAIGGVAAKIQGAIDGGCKAVIIPEDDLQEFHDAMLLDGPDTAWKIQIYAEPNLQQAEELIRTDRPKNLQEAMYLFSKVQGQFQVEGDRALYDPEVKSELEQVLALNPNCASARYMLLESQGKQPTKLSESASEYEALVDVYPLNDLILNGKTMVLNPDTLPAVVVNKMRRSLGELRNMSPDDTVPLVDDMLSLVNACDAVANGEANDQAIADQLGAVAGEFEALEMDHATMQKMIQQGI